MNLPDEALFRIELYCGNKDCSVREVRLRVKDYDSGFRSRHGSEDGFDGEPFACPSCSGRLNEHWARSDSESIEIDEREARASVRAQLSRRGRGDGLYLVSAAMTADPPGDDPLGDFVADKDKQ